MSQHLFSIFSVCLKSTSQLKGVQLSVLHYFGLATSRTQKFPCLQVSPKVSAS